jgi:hypothetical protein
MNADFKKLVLFKTGYPSRYILGETQWEYEKNNFLLFCVMFAKQKCKTVKVAPFVWNQGSL